MTESRDTWTTRDYPVLVAVAEHLESTNGRSFQPSVLADRLPSLDLPQINHALRQLSPTYVDLKPGQGMRRDASTFVLGLTDEGRRRAGLWPAEGTNHTQALVEALLSAAEEAETEEERGKIRKAADSLGRAASRVTEGAIAAVVGGMVSGSM